MHEIDFKPLKRRIPFIGLGCGRILGRDGFKQSAKIVEAALDLGIRYFDVAPSYGVGTAEEVLGSVIGSDPNVIIATKVGIPRPHYNVWKNRTKLLLKPFINRSVRIKQLILKMMQRPTTAHQESLHDFSPATVSRTLTESLERLRRETVDVLLAHEPTLGALNSELAAGFQNEVDKGRVRVYGIGIGAASEPWQEFGSVWQSCWTDKTDKEDQECGIARVFHGMIKGAIEMPGQHSTNIRNAMRRFVDDRPHAMLLVSASVPRRLKELVSIASDIA